MGAVIMGLLVILIGGLLYVRRKNLEFLYNRTYWAIGALVLINITFLFLALWCIKLLKLLNLYVAVFSTSNNNNNQARNIGRFWVINFFLFHTVCSVCHDVWSDVEPHSRTTLCTQKSTNRTSGKMLQYLLIGDSVKIGYSVLISPS